LPLLIERSLHFSARPVEVEMPSYAHHENIALYVKLLAESAQNTSARHKMLLRLLAEEKAKGRAPPAE
jgi:hypothetical protein